MAIFLTRTLFVRNIGAISNFSNLSCHNFANINVNKKCKGKVCFYKHVSYISKVSKIDEVRCFSTDRKEVENKNEEKLSLLKKFKIMYRDYWYVLLPVHIVTSTVWFGGFYFMAKSGLDIVALLESCHVSERFVNPLRDSSMGYFALSYALYKIATPARYTVTLGGTTISINYLKKWGYIKPVPSKERMKEIYEEKKDTLTKSMKDTKEGIKEKKDSLIETVREAKEGIIEKKETFMETLEETKKGLKESKDKILEGKESKHKSNNECLISSDKGKKKF